LLGFSLIEGQIKQLKGDGDGDHHLLSKSYWMCVGEERGKEPW